MNVIVIICFKIYVLLEITDTQSFCCFFYCELFHFAIKQYNGAKTKSWKCHEMFKIFN